MSAACDVLVVDDDHAIVQMVTEALALEAIPFRVATHGAEALARVEERRPAVILLDINMPVMDGPTFCAALDAGPGRSSIAVVLMTAGRDAHRLRDQTAADAVLAKPFSLDDLYTVVERYLAAS